MKSSILSLVAISCITATTLTNCNSSTKEVEDAQTNVIEATNDLNKANEEYLMEVESYKKETPDRISANEKSLSDFKAKVETEKQDAKADYKKKISELEQKNNDMKQKLVDYKEDGKDNWQRFKTEFNHDMDELGQAFKDLTVKNMN